MVGSVTLALNVLITTTAARSLPPRDAPSAHNATSPASSTLVWSDCSAIYGAGFTCANYTVPTDWAVPNGDQIMIGMNRFQSNTTGFAKKESLYLNPGGPGGIATSDLTVAAASFSHEVTSKYDLIAVDPRGLGLSTPIQCDTDLWNERLSYFPKTEAEFDRMVQHNIALGKSCLELTGNLLFHVDTLSIARDFEAVRIANGDDKFNFVGFSYGSQIAYQYAQLFPGSFGKLVGDGITNHAESETGSLVTGVQTYEDSFVRFATWAGTSNESALFGQDVLSLWDQLLVKLTETPLSVGSGPGHLDNITNEEFLFNFPEALISKEAGTGPGWAAVSEALALAFAGNGSGLASFAPAVVDGEIAANSGPFSYLAVGCLDWTYHSTTLADILYKQKLMTTWAPHTQGATQNYGYQTQCIGWPAPVINPPEQIELHTDIPILLVQSTHDPECSYTWAVELQAQLPSSVLLLREGDGHTSYLLGGETAAAVNAYLINGTLPAHNTVLQS
ncbi:hypothetical protein LTR78_004479 [Recurvomyces mirabilis]|uniref:Peptidase S33 tripeptidyl aminopeptidase-like C-terminal domain-containing protein n=1 Tax=Recurvomyces mirabilis TaxID=574656 RepID=A0AAE0WQ54_9PEZI|nr:hypothetical protein LTR78_004479 [Recurvomyces mirabilis]KAK5155855.1 hypothetical protein LTS14_005421 [Recurvomyces mirabilis]